MLFRSNKNTRRRPHLTFVAVTSSVLFAGFGLVSAGCGGGDGGSDLPGNASRAAAITAVRGVRGAAVQIASAGSLAGGLGDVTGLTTRARQVTRHASDTPHDEPELFPVEFDEAYGLYNQFATTDDENKFRINYFTDQQGRNSAGYFEMELVGDTETYPFTVKLKFDLTAGKEPGSGEFDIVVQSETRARVTGRSTDRLTGDKTSFDVTVDGERVVDSRLSLDGAGDEDVTIEDLDIAADETMTADLVAGGQRGTIRLGADGSGELNLGEGEGRITCAWDANGRGTLRDASGATVNIEDFDTAAAL